MNFCATIGQLQTSKEGGKKDEAGGGGVVEEHEDSRVSSSIHASSYHELFDLMLQFEFDLGTYNPP